MIGRSAVPTNERGEPPMAGPTRKATAAKATATSDTKPPTVTFIDEAPPSIDRGERESVWRPVLDQIRKANGKWAMIDLDGKTANSVRQAIRRMGGDEFKAVERN